jgi:hypothetical protein
MKTTCLSVCLFLSVILYQHLKTIDTILLFDMEEFNHQFFGNLFPALPTLPDRIVRTVIKKYFYPELLFKHP